MSKKRAETNPRRSPTRAAARPGRGARLVLAVLLLATLALAGWWWFDKTREDSLPLKVSLNNLDPAVERLLREKLGAVKVAPRSGAAWGVLGAALFAHGFDTQARAALERAVTLAPTEPRWAYRLAVVLMQRGETPDVILPRLRAAAELSGDSPDMPRLRLAQYLFEQGRPDEAQGHFEMLLRRQSDHPMALLGLARVRLAQGKPAEARDLASRCATNAHAAKAAHAVLAQAHQRLGQTAAAEEASLKSTRLPPDQPWPDPYLSDMPELLVGNRAMLDAAQQLIEAKQWTAAIRVLAQITNDYPADPDAYYGLGSVLNHERRFPEAEAALREHIRLSPGSAHGRLELAQTLLALQRPAEAVPVLERAIQVQPNLAKAHYHLGVACSQLGRIEDAVTHLRDAMKYAPNEIESCMFLSDLFSRHQRYQEAADCLKQVIQFRPAWATPYFNLGFVQAQSGQTVEAIASLRQALERSPNDPETLLLLGELLMRAGQTNEAVSLLRRASRLDPGDNRARLLLQEFGAAP